MDTESLWGMINFSSYSSGGSVVPQICQNTELNSSNELCCIYIIYLNKVNKINGNKAFHYVKMFSQYFHL